MITWPSIVHYGFHLIIPLIIAYYFFRPRYKQAYLIFLLAMLIDLDHLLASPVFDPNRCSIGFHYLHSYIAIGAYLVLLFFKKTHLVGIALLWHILSDGIDCWMMTL